VLRLVRVFALQRVVMRPSRDVQYRPDRQHAIVGRGDGGRIVKVQGSAAARGIIVVALVQRRPRRVVSVGEGPAGDVEFVGHHEVVGRPVDEARRRAQMRRGVLVDPSRVDAG